MILFSLHMQFSLFLWLMFLWLSSRLATFSASAGSNSSYIRAVSPLRATSCFRSLSYYPFQFRAILFGESASSCRPCMPSAMRGSVMVCTSLKNEEWKGSCATRKTLLMISLIHTNLLSKGVLLRIPLAHFAYYMYVVRSWVVLSAYCTWADFLCSQAAEILVSHLWAVSESMSDFPA